MAGFLFASLVWGSIGLGYFIFGKKQQSISAMAGGILMMVLAYFAGSVLVMSLVSVMIILGVYVLGKKGF